LTIDDRYDRPTPKRNRIMIKLNGTPNSHSRIRIISLPPFSRAGLASRTRHVF
jgi:hypothetical protein